MKLWIRSQEKERLILANGNMEIVGDDVIGYKIKIDGEQCPIGSYKTYERAKEVLNEIFEYLKPTLLFKGFVFPEETTYEQILKSGGIQLPENGEILEITKTYEMPEN